MTGSSGGPPDQHWKGGPCRHRHCSPDAARGLGVWAVWFRSREFNVEWWLLVAGSWACDCRHSIRPWGSFYVLVPDFWQNIVARLRINKSVWPNETSSGYLESWCRRLTPWNHLFCSWYVPTRCLVRADPWTVSKCQHLFHRLPFASSKVLF